MNRDAHEHNARVREQFRIQAPTFTDTGFAASNLDWILEQLGPRPGEQALDVACGAGHLGRALAPHVGHVNALDLTPEMLVHGDRLARDAGLGNVCFAVGDATALPWLDAQFDLVVCRLTLHQVADPAAVVREMVRVTRPDGRIGITDIVLVPGSADTDTEVDAGIVERNTHLERLRDPSHGRTLHPAGIRRMLADAGATVASTSTRETRLDLEDWMARSDTPATAREEIRRQLDSELAGGPATGLRPGHDADGRTLTHLWATVVATPGPVPAA
jgi:SAM-dependent methyltransferase